MQWVPRHLSTNTASNALMQYPPMHVFASGEVWHDYFERQEVLPERVDIVLTLALQRTLFRGYTFVSITVPVGTFLLFLDLLSIPPYLYVDL